MYRGAGGRKHWCGSARGGVATRFVLFMLRRFVLFMLHAHMIHAPCVYRSMNKGLLLNRLVTDSRPAQWGHFVLSGRLHPLTRTLAHENQDLTTIMQKAAMSGKRLRRKGGAEYTAEILKNQLKAHFYIGLNVSFF
jgi:hypothetical protein